MKDSTKKIDSSFQYAIKSVIIPIIMAILVAIATTHYARGCDEKKQRKDAKRYAEVLKKRYELELARKQADFETFWDDCNAACKDSIRKMKGQAGVRGTAYGGGVIRAEADIREHFEHLQESARTALCRFKEDVKLQIEAIESTGVILRID